VPQFGTLEVAAVVTHLVRQAPVARALVVTVVIVSQAQLVLLIPVVAVVAVDTIGVQEEPVAVV
jgi:hypothetical protein